MLDAALTVASGRMAAPRIQCPGMLHRIDRFLQPLGRFWHLLLALWLVALVGWLDLRSGAEMSFSIFYLAPVGLLAWYRGRRWGLAISLLAAFVWFSIDSRTGRPYSQPSMPYWNAAVRLGFFVITALLLARLRLALTELRRLAERDGLTGLYNARRLRQLCQRALAAMPDHGHPCSIVYFDVDGFKGINDRLGHSVGDEVLQAIGQRLLQCLRESDHAGRIGGDEFVVLAPVCDEATADRRAERLQRELRQLATERGWPIGFSIGVVVLNQPPANADAAIALADAQMYRAKQGGKDRICLAVAG